MAANNADSNNTNSNTTAEAQEDIEQRWYFTKEKIRTSPSVQDGIEHAKELGYRQQCANLVQDIGQRLQVSQLVINTAIVYMHRFYMLHSFAKFKRNTMGPCFLFLAAKIEENPRRLEHVLKATHVCLNKDEPPFDPKSDEYMRLQQELVDNESVLLQTLGFEIAVEHPNTYVVKCAQLVKASKELAQTAYFLATNSLHLTTFCIQYKPTVVACVCIYVSCLWANYMIPETESKNWYELIDNTVTKKMLEDLSAYFIKLLDLCPTRLKKRLTSGGAVVYKEGKVIAKKESGSKDCVTVKTEEDDKNDTKPSTSSAGSSSSASSFSIKPESSVKNHLIDILKPQPHESTPPPPKSSSTSSKVPHHHHHHKKHHEHKSSSDAHNKLPHPTLNNQKQHSSSSSQVDSPLRKEVKSEDVSTPMSTKTHDQAKIQQSSKTHDQAKIQQSLKTHDQAKIQQSLKTHDQAKMQQSLKTHDQAKMQQSSKPHDQAKMQQSSKPHDQAKMQQKMKNWTPQQLEEYRKRKEKEKVLHQQRKRHAERNEKDLSAGLLATPAKHDKSEQYNKDAAAARMQKHSQHHTNNPLKRQKTSDAAEHHKSRTHQPDSAQGGVAKVPPSDEKLNSELAHRIKKDPMLGYSGVSDCEKNSFSSPGSSSDSSHHNSSSHYKSNSRSTHSGNYKHTTYDQKPPTATDGVKPLPPPPAPPPIFNSNLNLNSIPIMHQSSIPMMHQSSKGDTRKHSNNHSNQIQYSIPPPPHPPRPPHPPQRPSHPKFV